MSKMISVASGFQYSVNIGYDLNDESKCRSFIPTRSALMLLEDILLSTVPSSSERSRILIGAYGKGKSHIVLMILSILMKKDIRLFEKMLPRIKENKKLEQLISNYYDSDNKILPVVISGSNTSLPQAFLLALQRTLSENSLLDAMPESNYKAAVDTINRWKKEFPNTYTELRNSINVSIETFIDGLKDYNVEFYETFEKVYPSLTSGSKFNPFLGFDVIELYEEAIRGLRSKGYSGIFVIYDEFSKFLEANISEASVSDTKMLQDFAEKCNRSGKMQMHLMLISHKEIANYIVDTTNMKPKDLKEEIGKIYSIGENNPKLTISVVSFGFKHGIPSDCDLVFDVRFLPNPYYIEDLRPKTGDDKEVRDYVMNSKISEEFYAKLTDMIQFLVPQYIEEGKQHLVIGIGCTGGRHRSVTISNLIYDDLVNRGYRVVKKHRDSMLR